MRCLGLSTLIFSYISRLGSFFGGQNFEFRYFWVFSENFKILGYDDFVDIFWGHHKIELVLGLFLCILGSFLKVNEQNGDICFWVAKISNIFFGCLIFLIIFFLVNGRC